MHITPLQAEDATRYRELMLQAYVHAADAFTSTAEERALEPLSFWAHRIADPRGMTAGFGAFEGSALLGAVALEFSAKPKTRHVALLVGMYLAPVLRGTGAARALLDATLAHARSRPGLRRVTLTATEGNEPALRLYRNAGFVAWGTEPEAILTPGGYKGKVHMTLDLGSAC